MPERLIWLLISHQGTMGQVSFQVANVKDAVDQEERRTGGGAEGKVMSQELRAQEGGRVPSRLSKAAENKQVKKETTPQVNKRKRMALYTAP